MGLLITRDIYINYMLALYNFSYVINYYTPIIVNAWEI